jgi:NDP-sugar pyrophosphorylase family protein
VREGYTKPKALIPVFDKTMIECVIDNLNGLVENYESFLIEKWYKYE